MRFISVLLSKRRQFIYSFTGKSTRWEGAELLLSNFRRFNQSRQWNEPSKLMVGRYWKLQSRLIYFNLTIGRFNRCLGPLDQWKALGIVWNSECKWLVVDVERTVWICLTYAAGLSIDVSSPSRLWDCVWSRSIARWKRFIYHRLVQNVFV